MLAANLLGRRNRSSAEDCHPFVLVQTWWIGSCKSLRGGYVHHPKSSQIANLQSFTISTHLFATNHTTFISFLQAHLKSKPSSSPQRWSPNGPAPKLSAKGFPNWFGAALMAATTRARTCHLGQLLCQPVGPTPQEPFKRRWYTQEIYPLCKVYMGVDH